jgi:hypothetical protein
VRVIVGEKINIQATKSIHESGVRL